MDTKFIILKAGESMEKSSIYPSLFKVFQGYPIITSEDFFTEFQLINA